MHESNVVLPHPEAPKRPYLWRINQYLFIGVSCMKSPWSFSDKLHFTQIAESVIAIQFPQTSGRAQVP